ncbi:hypothetical protein FOL47_004366 [Perkinsus chesapeaki]|uniref:Uncharacterized protein n=1 Tax=Perkinsus chesapeaki TaxID=330153 RepID=A0A7J6M3X9_PERCH|nr:hypothetical protein FOL47_004366 [Perkinsus chesapeaki]
MIRSSSIFISTILATLSVAQLDIIGTISHKSDYLTITYDFAPIADFHNTPGDVSFSISCGYGELFTDGRYYVNYGPYHRTYTINFKTHSTWPNLPGPADGHLYWFKEVSKVCPGAKLQEGDLINLTFETSDLAFVKFQGERVTLKRDVR